MGRRQCQTVHTNMLHYVEDIESMYQKICNEKYTIITDGIEELPFWENGVKFFMIKGPNEERIEFCQKL